MRWSHTLVAASVAAMLVACETQPTAPPPPPPPTIEEQIAAWNPRIVVEEPMAGFNPSLEIHTVTPGDTICYGTARFRIDSANVPDSIVWSLGAGIYTTKRFMVTDIPQGIHVIEAKLFRRFRSVSPRRDTVVERSLERSFVCLDYSASLTIGKWVPVDPTETRIDTLQVLYQVVLPETKNDWPINFVLGATRGCNVVYEDAEMYMVFRRYAVNFERSSSGGPCQQLFGELALSDRNNGLYRYEHRIPFKIDSVYVRRVQ
jgi:hypothetical protein